tara:strand:- start:418 stop:669 length:252 start_codon:yes stop_codon:yes gene_type:complete
MDKKSYQLRKEIEEETRDKLKKQGMLEKTIEKFLEGKKIKDCVECLTPNMYLVHQSRLYNSIDIYECYKCKKITPYKNNDKSI